MPSVNSASGPTNDSDRVSVPAPDGAPTLMEVLTRLTEANIELLDIGLRRPSLDEVFFALTKSEAERSSVVEVEFRKGGGSNRRGGPGSAGRRDDIEVSS
jgi:ABC-2 type transport system ATP-binding protein